MTLNIYSPSYLGTHIEERYITIFRMQNNSQIIICENISRPWFALTDDFQPRSFYVGLSADRIGPTSTAWRPDVDSRDPFGGTRVYSSTSLLSCLLSDDALHSLSSICRVVYHHFAGCLRILVVLRILCLTTLFFYVIWGNGSQLQPSAASLSTGMVSPIYR